MAESFSGDWTIEFVSKEADFAERFIVEGANTGNGTYVAEAGMPSISVSGPNWSIRFEWNDNAQSGWQASAVRKIAADSTLQNGLVVLLGIDDNFEGLRDRDWNDVVVRCRNVEPQLNPWLPFTNPYDFTVPKDVRQKGQVIEDGSRPVKR